MSSPTPSPLEADTGGALPPGLAALPAEQLARLSEAFRSMRERQLAALDKAIDEAIDHLPVLLRKQARKTFSS